MAGATCVGLLAAGALVGGALAAPGDPKTRLVSRESRSAGGDGADDTSEDAAISANGRFVAFATEGRNLGGPLRTQPNERSVYVYDREKRKVKLVSRQSSSRGGEGADGDSAQPAISADGRFVAFETEGQNLGGQLNATNGNIYVYDRERKRVRLVSRNNQGAGGDGQSFDPSISDDGRIVAFTTVAENLGGPLQTDPNGLNVYVFNRVRGRIELVSRQSDSAGGLGGDEDSFQSSLSASGRFVAFGTRSTNLGGPLQTPDPSDNNVYVYDRRRDRVRLISRQSASQGGGGADDSSTNPSVSSSGRFIGFQTEADNLGGPIDPANTEDNVYLYDRKLRKVRLISRRSASKGGAGANSDADNPDVSNSARFIAFETNASNLGGPRNPANSENDVYVYDRERKRVQLVSRRSGARGTGGDASSEEAAISGSGRFVAFETQADNLGGPIDPAAFTNIYVRDRGR